MNVNINNDDFYNIKDIKIYDENYNLIGYSKNLRTSKSMINSKIKEEILKVLSKSKKELTELEIKKSVPEINRRILRELLRKGQIIKHKEYLYNTQKTFTHSKTKKIEVHKGTEVYKYRLARNNKGDK